MSELQITKAESVNYTQFVLGLRGLQYLAETFRADCGPSGHFAFRKANTSFRMTRRTKNRVLQIFTARKYVAAQMLSATSLVR